ncbi:cytochrome C oxidase subunit I [Herbaspirillum sp. RTI4]|uniref:SCO family protein n=1 Tax=Herbaspirillum sp. RTI4 TaxID=3048640 RepID=UPI002AB4B2A6|nr:cytochrome C oxidase subunit I [Herbaspirillum sp. RTI4]MDY7577703.1 cytochrome C oxidase subunit I [Herbaspirillum sp. RTI4]MEA9980869.1 cytochrome C oxidase subunit I [Herbaspirillum sp. RTI4]
MDQNKQKGRGRWWLLLILLVCAMPMIGSYLTYYVIKPEGRTNYGTLIDPRNYPIPALDSHLLSGAPASLNDYKGKWIMLQADSGDCGDSCRNKLLSLRQLRLMQGKEMERIERVWLITDQAPLDTMVMREYDGTRMLRVDPALLKAWLPTLPETTVQDHIYLIDPRGNLMMRFPKDADPNLIKKDLSKLLKASSIG